MSGIASGGNRPLLSAAALEVRTQRREVVDEVSLVANTISAVVTALVRPKTFIVLARCPKEKIPAHSPSLRHQNRNCAIEKRNLQPL